jgi:NADH-quinone oxidoreductase subunit F
MILFPEGRPLHLESFEEYCAAGGYSPLTRDTLNEVSASGLRGRGGAGFPVGKKWRIAAETSADARYVVCNAGEDEPGSFKDRLLLEHRPHLVLDGMILAARAISAQHAYVYLNETYEKCRERMSAALEEARAAGFMEGVTVSIERAPTVYVAGEDSAALEVLECRPPKPRQKPPYPASAGLFGKPTVVNNVETLANVPSIVRNGASWFRQFGTPESPGTMIFCLGNEMNYPGAYELSLGTPLRQLFEITGGGLRDGKKLKAILPGGPSCAFLTPDQLDIPLDPESLKRAGSTLGCGVMRFYAEGACMVEETLRIAQFFAKESCGQCPACRMETTILSTMVERIHQGKSDAALFDQFQKIIDFNRGKGYCALINMPALPVMSALRLFRDEFEFHLRHGHCA